jgi:hypothetical protein
MGGRIKTGQISPSLTAPPEVTVASSVMRILPDD